MALRTDSTHRLLGYKGRRERTKTKAIVRSGREVCCVRSACRRFALCRRAFLAGTASQSVFVRQRRRSGDLPDIECRRETSANSEWSIERVAERVGLLLGGFSVARSAALLRQIVGLTRRSEVIERLVGAATRLIAAYSFPHAVDRDDSGLSVRCEVGCHSVRAESREIERVRDSSELAIDHIGKVSERKVECAGRRRPRYANCDARDRNRSEFRPSS